jgi:glucose/arabinose dehydrogenase
LPAAEVGSGEAQPIVESARALAPFAQEIVMRLKKSVALAAAACVVAAGSIASAGSLGTLTRETVATGFSRPVHMVPHPTVADAFVVVEQGGTVRILQNGVITGTLVTVAVGSSSGERGLFSIAFDPNFAATGRFFVNHTNASGTTVIARYTVSSDPLVADPTSRTEILTIAQPFSNHNGGCIAFGPDGYLYIGTGDGGSAGDPGNRSQTPSTLLGKMLRIDVSGPGTYTIPSDNPFLPANNPPVTNALPEIWAFGVRNPWKFTFDDFGFTATDGMFIADVGQNAIEEINYQPAAQGGMNWGWRIREGTNNFNTSLPPAYTPLTDPIFQYSHSLGFSISGGYAYRGAAMCSYIGRYFYADYGSGRVWSFELTDAGLAVDNIDHSAALYPAGRTTISGFGRGHDGELYLIEWSLGRISKIVSDDVPSAGDINQDGLTNFTDLNIVLAEYGVEYNFGDLNSVLTGFGGSCNGK